MLDAQWRRQSSLHGCIRVRFGSGTFPYMGIKSSHSLCWVVQLPWEYLSLSRRCAPLCFASFLYIIWHNHTTTSVPGEEGTGSFSCSSRRCCPPPCLGCRQDPMVLSWFCPVFSMRIKCCTIHVFLVDPSHLQTMQWGDFLGLWLLVAGTVLFFVILHAWDSSPGSWKRVSLAQKRIFSIYYRSLAKIIKKCCK